MAKVKPTRFRCRLCRRKAKIFFTCRPVPEALEVCPSCWASKDIPTRELKAAIVAKISKARLERRRGDPIGMVRVYAYEGRCMLKRLQAMQKKFDS